MGFSSFHDKPTSPARVYNKWGGGEGKLSHWDGQVQNTDGSIGANVTENLPFKFAILEQSRRISGFAPGTTTTTRYYSNETVEYNDVITVMAKTGDAPAVKVLEGKYSDIKPKLPQGARLAIQLYVYVPERDQIECITCQGASLSAFIEFSKKNKIYENYIQMEKGEKMTKGTVSYYPPKFTLAEPYDKDTMNKLSEVDKKVIDYLKHVHDSNYESIDINGIDQTPAQYDGEQSQEPVSEQKASTPAPQEINFNDIPF